MSRVELLILISSAVLFGGVLALAKAIARMKPVRPADGDQARPADGDQARPADGDQAPSEFELAIIQAASDGLKGQRLVIELRKLGVLTNRETVRKAVKALRERGYYV